MSVTVEINIHGRNYPVVCNEADAPRIRELGRDLSARATKLQSDLGGLVEASHLLVLTNLMALDELLDAKSRATMPVTIEKIVEVEKIIEQDNSAEQEILVQAVTHLTNRVNSIAQRLRAA